MTELQRLKQLLDELCIDWHMENYQAIVLDTVPVKIYPTLTRGCYIKGWGFSGIWLYSAEFVAKMLDRKFREEAANNQYLLRMQKEGAADEPERKTVRKNRMRKKSNRRNRSKASR